MAALSYTGISDFTIRSAAGINAPWAEIATESTNIDAENFRDEGLDLRNMASAIATDGYDLTEYDGANETFVALNAWTDIQYTAGAVLMRCTNGGVGWAPSVEVGVTHYLRVRFAIAFLYTPAAPAAVRFPIIRFRLRYNTNAGTFNATQTETEHQGYGQVAETVTALVPAFRDSCAISYLVTVSAAGTTVNWVQAQAMIDTGNLTLGRSTLQVTRFLKTA